MRTLSRALRPSRSRKACVLEQLDDAGGRVFDIVDQEAADAVLDLMLDAADIAADHGGTFPHRLGDGQAEALADRILQHHRGAPLQGVDQCGVLHRQDADALLGL